MPTTGRISPSGNWLAFQLKTTTNKQVAKQGNLIAYDLRSKNFNDLIFRKKLLSDGFFRVTPLLLALLVLPDDPKRWLVADPTLKRFTFNGSFYWFFPGEELGFPTTTSSKRIFIPTENQIDLHFFNHAFNLFF